jgi:hypothetical protein
MAGIALNYIGFLASGAIGTIPLIKQHFDSPKTSHTTTVRIGLGHNATTNAILGGNLPGVSLWNEQGKAIGSSTGGKPPSQSSFTDVQISAHPNIGDDSAAYVSINAENDDAICVAYVTVSQANGDSSTFTGDVLAKCGATYYESSTTLGTDGSHPKCVWISKNGVNGTVQDQGFGFHVRDFFGTDAQAKAYASNSDLMCESGPRFRMYRQLDAKDPILFYDPALKYNQDGTDVDPSKVINNPGKLTETDKKRKRDHMSMQDTEAHHNGTHHHTSKTWDSMYTSAADAHSRAHHDRTDYPPSKTWDSMSTGTPEANHRMHHNGTHHHTDKTWASTYTGNSEASSRTHRNGTHHHTGATWASTYTDTPGSYPPSAPTCTDTSESNPSTWAPTSTDADPANSTDDSDPSTQNDNKRKRDHMSMESSKTHHNGTHHHTSKTWHSMSTKTHKANHKTHHNGTRHHTSTSWASTPTDTNTDPSSSIDGSDPSTQNDENRKRNEISMQDTKPHHNGTHSHTGTNRPSAPTQTHSSHPKTTGTPPWRFSGTLIISDISTHSASNLCAAHNSYGPDFVATKEGKFCDMKNKHLWDVCTEQKTTCCFDVTQKKLQACAGARKRGGISWRQVASVREVVEYTDVQHW